MKKILESWEKFLIEQVIPTQKELIDIIRANPNQEINIDTPKGKTKKFGGLKKVKLEFDYGEWPKLINPADDMGWDLIIVPSSSGKQKNLLPVGYIKYKDDDETWENVGKAKPKNIGQNTKIILGADGVCKENDKKIIENFFGKLIQFKTVVWF
tara:strand:- start:2065 stop:2526 length:462 start_codon:yes stop_codon:yes gene_type:complete